MKRVAERSIHLGLKVWVALKLEQVDVKADSKNYCQERAFLSYTYMNTSIERPLNHFDVPYTVASIHASIGTQTGGEGFCRHETSHQKAVPSGAHEDHLMHHLCGSK